MLNALDLHVMIQEEVFKTEMEKEPYIISEVEYTDSEKGSIHSDLDCDMEIFKTQKYKELVHKYLDEWLNKSNGTGGFYIRNSNHTFEKNI